ncbi:DctM-like transporter [Anaerotignum neopropionicum]|uniref:DctM-like transporter n=1 Tax=Anaerotignum neopropionicum TaxID=36847 RepID=A0A136WJ28_9FIRM|nr:TRAP transporter permease [Anaerotignum neopropionicum]KXL54505.1 DctM-like transporter [Anaerotignum neopropionicum]
MFKKKEKISLENIAAFHAEVNDADLEAVMKKYDREANIRHFEGIPKIIVKCMLIAFALFMVYMNLFANWGEQVRRCLFLGSVIILIFTVYPRKKGMAQKPNHIPWYDWILGIAGSASFFYYVIHFNEIIQKATRIGQLEVVLGVIGILVLTEACRRVTGIPIILVATGFVLYAFSTGLPLRRIIYNLFYTTTGVIGVPIGVCSTFIVLFIIFGAFLEATGISNFFIQCANSIAGASSGGPAKVAVISSALCGMVSGSSVGNTVTTGSVTIPMMKKTGYPPEFAGAVEAAASTGGQIMPPIMGAAAFLMAEMCGVEYASIIQKAILPAFLYFSGIFLMVHFKARKLKLMGIPKEELPKFSHLVKNIYLLLPLVVLVYMIIDGYTMSRSAIFATLVAIAVSMFNKENRMTVNGFFSALENGGKGTLSVAAACGMAGIIAGVVSMTGLGQIFISGIVSIAGNNLIIALMLTMVCCIILGMGVPTTANYIIMATTCAPILITGMNMDIIAANMFVFYFGIVADITPPVALAAYAGSAIAGANPMKTAFNATMLAIAAFIIPYVFAYNEALLFINTTPLQVIQVVVTSFVGMFAISGGMIGYMLRDLNPILRIISIGCGLMLIYPSIGTDVLGIIVIGSIVAMQLIASKRELKTAA